MSNSFITSLEKHTEADWLAAVDSLAADIHEVDRTATQVWFRFYPLDLVRYLRSAENIDEAKRSIAMQGDFGLEDRIDTSHSFLYGHRFWPNVKAAIDTRAASDTPAADLITEIRSIARAAAEAAKTKEPLTLGIVAAGLMTLMQVGPEAFKAAAGVASKPSGILAKSPDDIVRVRKEDDSQGIFGFLKTVDKKFSVTHNEYTSRDRFTILNDQEIAAASALDRSQDWQSKDKRCWEGPVPVECTSASCGTCWVGILGGAEKLNEPSVRERKQMKVFGYNQPEEPKPFLRLACQSRTTGNVTLVIPPWNAVFGKKIRGNVEDVELEPVTTSAKKLRETVASATKSE